MTASDFGVLRGLKVLDLTQALAGPYATMLLADHGANVIKVESLKGDLTRGAGPFFDDDQSKTHGGYFQSLNRNKKSLAIDLKSPAGVDLFLDLVQDTDVVAENFRHGVMESLGLSYERLQERNPKLVYAALRGFGDKRTGASDYTEWPAFDIIAQAMGGIMSITGPENGSPTKVGPGVGDIVPGMFLAFGILAAVYQTKISGKGQFVDVAMVDSILAICERIIYQHQTHKVAPGPEGNHHPFLMPFGVFPASDGQISIAAPSQEFFTSLCHALGLEEIAQLEGGQASNKNAFEWRAASKEAVIEKISAETRKYSRSELKSLLGGKVPIGPVMDMADISKDEYFDQRDMLPQIPEPGSSKMRTVAGLPVKMKETPGSVRTPAPHIGQHTRQVLLDAGYEDATINKLFFDGVIKEFKTGGQD